MEAGSEKKARAPPQPSTRQGQTLLSLLFLVPARLRPQDSSTVRNELSCADTIDDRDEREPGPETEENAELDDTLYVESAKLQPCSNPDKDLQRVLKVGVASSFVVRSPRLSFASSFVRPVFRSPRRHARAVSLVVM